MYISEIMYISKEHLEDFVQMLKNNKSYIQDNIAKLFFGDENDYRKYNIHIKKINSKRKYQIYFHNKQLKIHTPFIIISGEINSDNKALITFARITDKEKLKSFIQNLLRNYKLKYIKNEL